MKSLFLIFFLIVVSDCFAAKTIFNNQINLGVTSSTDDKVFQFGQDATKGCIRFDHSESDLEFSNDCSSYNDIISLADVNTRLGVTTVLGTSETQTLTNKTFDDSLTIKQVAVPSNPASGYNKIYINSEGKARLLDSSGGDAALGGGSGVGSASILTVIKPEGESMEVSDWTTSLTNVLFAVNETTPLAGEKDYKLTNHTSGGAEYIEFSVTLSPRNKDKDIKVTMPYKYSGGSDDDIEMRLYDNSNNLLDTQKIKLNDNGLMQAIGFVESGDTAIKVRLYIATGSAGILYFDDIELSDDAFKEIKIMDKQYVHYSGGAGYGSTNTKIPYFSTEQENSGDAILIIENSSTNGFSATCNRAKCIVNASAVMAFSTAGWGGFSLNSTDLSNFITAISENTALTAGYSTGGNEAPNLSISIILNRGDILRPHNNGEAFATATPPRIHITINAIAESNAIVHASTRSSEELHYAGYAGYGSSATKIPYFSNIITDTSGNLFSYTNDSTNGFVLTARKNIIVNMRYVGVHGNGPTGISKNSSELTTNIYSIAQSDRISMNNGDNSCSASETTAHIKLNVGDKLRPHTAGVTGCSVNEDLLFINATIDPASTIITPITETCYIDTDPSSYHNQIAGSTSYKTRNLESLSGDCSFISIDSDQATIASGKYEVVMQVARQSNPSWLSLLVYNNTDATNVEEFEYVSFSNSGDVSMVNVPMSMTLSKTTVIEFQTKSTANGYENIGRIKIKRLKGGE